MATLKPQQKIILATIVGILFILVLIALRPASPERQDAVTLETITRETETQPADTTQETASLKSPQVAEDAAPTPVTEPEITGTSAPDGMIVPVRKPVIGTDGTVNDAPVPATPAAPAPAPAIIPQTPAVPEPEAIPAVEPVPVPEEEPAPVAEEPVTPAAPKLPLSQDGLYQVECIIPAMGTMLGEVEADDEDTHPSQQETIGIRNRNTGKITRVEIAGSSCLFTPISKE